MAAPILLSDKPSRLHPRLVVAKPAQTYEPEVPVKMREWIGPALRRLTLCLNLNVGFRYEHSSDWISSTSPQPRRGRGRCPGGTGVLVGFIAGWIGETENISETSDSNRVKYISDICVVPDLRGGGSPQNTQRQSSSIFPTSESRLRMVDAATPSTMLCAVRGGG
jgi:hypothetical protein